MIKVNMTKAKEIAHTVRRNKRDVAFKSLDIEATIPSKAVAAEASRQLIRAADDALQISMDSAVDEVGLKALMVSNDLL